MRGKLIDLTNQTFGRWSVLRRVENRHGNQPYWRCQCDCGTERDVCGQMLRSGGSISCGCSRKGNGNRRQHGMTRTRVHSIWVRMHERCNDPASKIFKYYGGRGIEVCARWDSFSDFLADMGAPEAKQSIDRIDVDGNYEPSNCRWADATQQARNTRRNMRLSFNGETLCLSEWQERLGVNQKTLARRVRDGWTAERALLTPMRSMKL